MPVRYLPPAQVMVKKAPNYSAYAKSPELKSCDFTFNFAPIPSVTNTNNAIQVCNCVQPGTGSWNRIGKKIRMKSIRYKAILQYNNDPTATNANNSIRCLLVFDKQPSSGAIPTFDTMFGSTDQTGAETTTSF